MTKKPAQPALFAEPEPKAETKAKVKTKPKAKQEPVIEPAKPKQEVATIASKAPALSDEGASEVAILLKAVTDPLVDVAKARAIEEMIERRRAAHAKSLFIKDYIALQSELPEINRDGKIVIEGKPGKAGQKTPYATFPNLYREIKPILQKHHFGFVTQPDVGKDGIGIIVRGRLIHDGGHEIDGVLPLPLETSGSKNNLQGVGSSLSYGRRYLAILLCQIITSAAEDADLDGNAPRPKGKAGKSAAPDAEQQAEAAGGAIDMEQAQVLAAKIKDSGVPLDRFCTKYGVETPAELPVAMFKEAIAALEHYKAQHAPQAG